MVNKFTIYGERCTGTNYLESLMVNNFDVSVTWDYGWKHFFGWHSLNNSDDTLFIGIVRNPVDWLNSFYKTPHHLPPHLQPKLLHPKWKNNIKLQAIAHNINAYNFLNKEFYSVHHDNPKENIEDRNMYTKKRYTNIFEMRHTKLKFLMKDMPNKVKHYILIKYEDLMHNFEATMKRIQAAGQLTIKPDILSSSSFPKNIYTYKGIKNGNEYSKDTNSISKPLPPRKILNHPKFVKTFEKQLGYVK